MALSLSSQRSVAVSSCRSRPAPRRLAAPPRAGLGDAVKDIADGFMKIFSKPTSTVDDWSGAGSTAWPGRIDHHEGRGKPFKDGFVGKKGAGDAAAAAAEAEEGASYLGEAVQRLAGHNFTGDDTEPPATTGAAGWKGDTHDKKRGDGFHARKV